ncbi:MAG: class I SAM-dependent methyltransferase [bacterium]|nr:class I SAM-dependent methyltransferase [bacterium]
MPFDFHHAELETLPCDSCGSDEFTILARTEKHGLPVRTVMCKRCGLIAINPRMTRAGYDEYYRYFYRDDRSAAKGKKEADAAVNFAAARRFGAALARRFSAYLKPGLAIDVGSSTGGVLAGLADVVPGLTLLGIEPSVEESAYALMRGIKTYTGLIENFNEALPPAQAILCVQSLNHLLDPKGFFRWAFARLAPGGHLILSVKNFRYQVRRAGRIEAGVQIDHPFMFTPETLCALVKSAGFGIVVLEDDEALGAQERARRRKEGLTHHHIRIVAERPENGVAPQSVMRQRSHYRKLRVQFSRPMIKLHYLLYYAQRTALLRRLGIVKV